MAEWTGRRRERVREESPVVVPTASEPDPVRNTPQAPGAVASPQHPGMVPDRSTVPGHFSTSVEPPAGVVRRPLTEYGSAQRILDLFAAEPGHELDPKRFTYSPVSDEERRKSNPDFGTPVRPVANYALGRNAAPALTAPKREEALPAGSAPAGTESARAATAASAAASPQAATAADGTAAVPQSTAAAPGSPTTSAPGAPDVSHAVTDSPAVPLAATETLPASGRSGTGSLAAAAQAAATASAAGKEQTAKGAASIASAEAIGHGTTAAESRARSDAAMTRGAVRGTGSHDCPPSHPVKGNAQSGIYHAPESPFYDRTIPEFCFRTVADADAAGFRAPRG